MAVTKVWQRASISVLVSYTDREQLGARLRQSLKLVKECEDTIDRYDVASAEQERAIVAELQAMIDSAIEGLHETDVKVTGSEGEEEVGFPQSTVAGPAKPQVEQESETPGPVSAIKDTVLAPIEEESSQAGDGRPFCADASSPRRITVEDEYLAEG
ncbi:hypothetical protein LTR27_008327 [Elasticomyces elasticus]|nr:hypothetical protein LTR27_008327 [Elasticomyces elasticus]